MRLIPPTLLATLLPLASTSPVLPQPDQQHPLTLTPHPSNTKGQGPLFTTPQTLPLLIWHGLGDRHDATGLHSLGDLAQEVYPGTRVYYIRTDASGSQDRTNTFFGNVSAQLEDVCAAIAEEFHLPDPDPAEENAAAVRVNAVGLSQGGQFLRGLQERCPRVEVANLLTFGAQHNGIAEFQACGRWDLVCKGASALVGGNAWTDYVQRTVVPAQYYRPVNETTGEPQGGYLEGSGFLGDVNCERGRYRGVEGWGEVGKGVRERQARYAERVAGMENLVMFVFAEDTTVVPKESGWFAEVNRTNGVVTPLRERRIYTEDWVGLRRLDEKGGLHFRNASGGHMDLDDELLRGAFEEFLGPAKGEVAVGSEWVMVEEQGKEESVGNEVANDGTRRSMGWRALLRPLMGCN